MWVRGETLAWHVQSPEFDPQPCKKENITKAQHQPLKSLGMFS
jgi:hypothetical protein